MSQAGSGRQLSRSQRGPRLLLLTITGPVSATARRSPTSRGYETSTARPVGREYAKKCLHTRAQLRMIDIDEYGTPALGGQHHQRIVGR
jgi:hypothetical protein